MALVFDIVDPVELTADTRVLDFRTVGFTLDAFLPNRSIGDVDFAFNRMTQTRPEMAVYRAFDVPARIAKRPGLDRVRGTIPPLSEKIPVGEEQTIRLAMAQGRDASLLRDQIFADARNLAEAVQARLEYARGQVLSTGKVTFDGIDEGFEDIEIDYGVPAGQFNTVGTSWATTATADPVSDMQTSVEEFMAANGGRRPFAAIISSQTEGDLMRNDKLATIEAGGAARVRDILSMDMVGAIFQSYRLPPLITYDTEVMIAGTSTRVIPADKIILVDRPSGQAFGETLWGVTAEALELVGRGDVRLELTQAPGLMVVNYKTDDAVQTWTKATAVAVPILKNSHGIVVLDTRP